MNRWRIFLRFALISALVWIVLWVIVGIVAVDGALHPGRRKLQAPDIALAQSIAVSRNAAFDNVAIIAADGAVLRAWSMQPRTPNGDAVILLHGQADNRSGMLGIGEMLLRHGYSLLLPDARAHGESGGRVATYGYLEAGDVERWTEWIAQTWRPNCINGVGESMGAAELLNALPSTEFCAVVAESAFSSFRSASYERLGQAFHTGPWLGHTLLRPAVEFAFLYARVRYGAHLAEASPIEAVARTHVPVLLIHGGADTNLVPRNSERIQQANARVALWEPQGAGHCGATDAAPAEYEQRVTTWFTSHREH